MNAEELQERTKKFAVDIVRFARTRPGDGSSGAMTKQLVRAGTSVAANYRACCRARSRSEFNAKLGVVAEEADETVFWLELLIQSGTEQGLEVSSLLQEARQLRAIVAASANSPPQPRSQ